MSDLLKICLKYSFVTGAVFVTAWDHICYFCPVSGPSMQPLINSGENNDYVFILRPLNIANIFKRPAMENILNRGDVVSVVSPKNPKECLIKRVVGLPGDLVKTVNYKSKYVRVPEGHCWIEGDNFKKSYDSNAFGCVPMGLVLGQAKLLVNNKIIFPPSFSSIKSHLPTHRKLKKLSNNEHDENFLVDLKSTTNEDEDDDENDDKNENDEN